MKSFKILFCFLLIGAVAFNSCQKESFVTGESDAVIRNTGSVDASGCGYLVQIKSRNTTYSPVNLPVEFQIVDTLNVHLKYKLLKTTFNCGPIAGGGYGEVEVSDITQ